MSGYCGCGFSNAASRARIGGLTPERRKQVDLDFPRVASAGDEDAIRTPDSHLRAADDNVAVQRDLIDRGDGCAAGFHDDRGESERELRRLRCGGADRVSLEGERRKNGDDCDDDVFFHFGFWFGLATAPVRAV